MLNKGFPKERIKPGKKDNYQLNNGNFDYCDYDEKVISKNDYSLIGTYELHEKRQLLNNLQLIIQNIRNQKEKIQ